MARAHVLTVHAAYACRQRGVCCRAGWPIPVEAGRVDALAEAVETGRLTPRAPSAPFDAPPDAPQETPVLLARPDGRCTFFDDDPARCRIHASLGAGALPIACHQFPRITIQDPRGASVTLSHYCPTAAALLDTQQPVAIVSDAAAFPSSREYVGLDARAGLPPLLRPDMAMDWEAWWEFERLAVDLVGNGTTGFDRDLARLRGTVALARNWSRDAGPLTSHVRHAFRTSAALERPVDTYAALRTITGAIPEQLRRQIPRVPARTADRPAGRQVRNFLAAHAFANWTAYLGLDLEAWMASLEAAHALVTGGWSFGEVDLIVRHLADPWALARIWSGAGRS